MSEPEPVRRGRRRVWKGAVVAACVAAACLFIAIGATLWTFGELWPTTFAMHEVPIPDMQTWMGPDAVCHGQPSQGVKRYPDFDSTAPLYGEFFPKHLYGGGKPEAGYFFAIDESHGTGRGYDTLYLDTNRDLDLTDDKPAKVNRRLGASGTGEIRLDFLTIPGAGDGGADLTVAPMIMMMPGGEIGVGFRTAYARQGRIRMGWRTYEATLTRSDLTCPRYDMPLASVHLYAPQRGVSIWRGIYWRWAGMEDLRGALACMSSVGRFWFRLSTTPNGDSLIVHPYRGDLGAFRISYGASTAGNFIVNGELHGANGIGVGLPPRDMFAGAPDRDLLIPVGEYAPSYMNICAGPYLFSVRRPHPGLKHDQYAQSEYFIKVRKDEPCVLEIPSSAQILWWGSDEARVFMPGDVVSVMPTLETPTITISSITPIRGAHACSLSIKIEDSAGNTLTESAAPLTEYSWRIPPECAPRNGRETLKITATWDTGELFGVVTGTKEIVVESTDAGDGK